MTMTIDPTSPPSRVDAVPPTRTAREAKRLRARARVEAAQRAAPSLRIDRLAPILAMLRAYRERDPAPDERSPLALYLTTLTHEVEELEAWADTRGRRAQSEGHAIRQALEFLRTFARVTSLDFSSVPVEERPSLVALLALEHRWCYAAAGTSRDVFKVAIGRTGAR
jgi:hypothetical protein